MFSEERTLFISRKAGVSELSSLIGCVKECGFDETSYLTANADLRTAGLDPASALFHFLAYGVDEHRDVPGGNRRTGRNGWPLCLSCVTAGPRSGSPATMLDRCTAVKYCDGPGRPRVCHSTSMCRSFSSSAGSMQNSCGFGGESGKARTGFCSMNSMRSLESRSADMGCSSTHSAVLSIPNC